MRRLPSLGVLGWSRGLIALIGLLDRGFRHPLHGRHSFALVDQVPAFGFDHVHSRDTLGRFPGLDGIRALGLGGFRLGPTPPRPPLGLFAIILVVGLSLGEFHFFGEKRLAIRHRDLVVVRMNFREGKEAVAVSTIVHEGRLERRLHARDLGEVDVSG